MRNVLTIMNIDNEMEKKGLIPAVQFEECSLAYNNQSQSLSAEDCSAKTGVPTLNFVV